MNESNPDRATLQLFDPRRGDPEFKLMRLQPGAPFSGPQRFNYFTVFCLREGAGVYHADLSTGTFAGPVLLCFNPYQTFFLEATDPLDGTVLQFHANFFCIETHHQAVGCNGVLFNDVYGQPLVRLNTSQSAEFDDLLMQMMRELCDSGVAQAEALVSLLKMFLIKATRLKLEQDKLPLDAATANKPPVLETLVALIEEHFRTRHAPADYAEALHITPKSLGKLVKAHFGRTLTELIRDRLLKHAKWQLLHTQRPVKEIAWEIGFADEFYFSRLFKQSTGLAPTAFREFETAIRGGRNLSM